MRKLSGACHSNKKCCLQIPTGLIASSGCQERKPYVDKHRHSMRNSQASDRSSCNSHRLEGESQREIEMWESELIALVEGESLSRQLPLATVALSPRWVPKSLEFDLGFVGGNGQTAERGRERRVRKGMVEK